MRGGWVEWLGVLRRVFGMALQDEDMAITATEEAVGGGAITVGDSNTWAVVWVVRGIVGGKGSPCGSDGGTHHENTIFESGKAFANEL
jgi:hypothetical protein